MSIIWQIVIYILGSILLLLVISDIGNRIRAREHMEEEYGENRNLLPGDSASLMLNHEKFTIYYNGDNYIFKKRRK